MSILTKKILFVTRPLSPPWDEASKNFAYDLACNIGDYAVTIPVDVINPHTPITVTQKQIYSSNNFTLWQKVRLVFFLWQNAQQFDLIHLLFTPTKFNSAVLKFVLKNKDVKVIQTIATVRDDLYSTKDLKKMYFGDMLVTYSQWAKTKLEKMGFTNIRQIYPGINLSKFSPSPKNSTLLSQLGFSETDMIVSYPGEFVRLGATDLIIDTFLDIWKEPTNTHIKYLCACRIKNDADQKKKEELIHRLTVAGYRNHVVFTDTFSDVNALYNLADIIIFPVTSMKGKFDVPLAMIEPYACKKPVIASDLELFREFSSDAINVIIPTAQKEPLRHAILTLATDHIQRKALGESAFIFAHQTFDIKNVARNYIRIYEQL